MKEKKKAVPARLICVTGYSRKEAGLYLLFLGVLRLERIQGGVGLHKGGCVAWQRNGPILTLGVNFFFGFLLGDVSVGVCSEGVDGERSYWYE